MSEKKFTLVAVTKEEQEAFDTDFKSLLEKHSVQFSVGIQKQQVGIKADDGQVVTCFVDQVTASIQKKVEEVTPEIISPLSEEMTGNESSPKA